MQTQNLLTIYNNRIIVNSKLIKIIGIIYNHVHGLMELVYLQIIYLLNKIATLILIILPNRVLMEMVFILLLILYNQKQLLKKINAYVLSYLLNMNVVYFPVFVKWYFIDNNYDCDSSNWID
ncbi:unnamed protein product [Paramecium pentaurelia]|uniref:Uncharacterized protein n=1 Tax=Paramecium pentaurelia TaxID=43138 RepID=A0A8S1XL02_9CILI|nr:unnamed protein product [Paramecium pentaurelia]